MPAPIEIFVAFHKKELLIAQSLIDNLRNSKDPTIVVFTGNDVDAGQSWELSLTNLLTRCKMIICLISSSFLADHQYRLIERYQNSSYLIPILTRHCLYDNTCYEGLIPLPRNRRFLMDIMRQREKVIVEDVLTPLLDQIRRSTAREDARQVLDPVSLPSQTPGATGPYSSVAEPTYLQTVLADWSLRHEYLSKLAERYRERDIPEFLDEIEVTLRLLPPLRCNQDDRWMVWQDQLVEYLNTRFPKQKLRERLYSPSKDWFQREQQLFTDSELNSVRKPKIFCPENPLGEVLKLLGTEAAARWLLLGLCHIGPELEFPSRAPGKHRYELHTLLRSAAYKRHLNGEARSRIERSVRAHQAQCPSLLAVLHDSASADELETALRLLHQFRSGAPMAPLEWKGVCSAKSAALLNLLGALALWQSNVKLAALAYRLAFRRARRERNLIAGWIAAEGAVVATAWLRQWRRDVRDTQKYWQKRLFEAKRQTVSQYILRRIEAHEEEVRHKLLNTLHDKLANDQAELLSHPAFGVFADQLEDLVSDQEELGCPPMMTAGSATLLGGVRLLDGSAHTAEQLPDAVRLLCRYGASGLTDRAQFFSPALHPFHPGRETIWRTVLAEGRTPSEWLGKLAFLQRHAATLPPALSPAALTFLSSALAALLHADKVNNGMIVRLEGSNFGSLVSWHILGTQIHQAMFLAAHTPEGVATAGDLLRRKEPRISAPVLENLQIFPWTEVVKLGLVKPEALTELAESVTEVLNQDTSAPLFQSSRWQRGLSFSRDDRIPLGLAGLLSGLQSAGIAPERLKPLHQQMCRLIEAGLSRCPEVFRRCLVADPVWSWLRARRDQATRRFVRGAVKALLARLDKYATPSTYFDVYKYVAQILPDLDRGQLRSLDKIIEKHQQTLLSDVATIDYAVHPLVAFAVQRLCRRSKHGGLAESITYDWIRNAHPLPELLPELTTLPAELLGPLEPTVCLAISHTLSGVTTAPMPWFHNRSASGTHLTPCSDELIEHGLHAVICAIDRHPNQPPSCGYSSWLDLVLAHCYHRNPKIAGSAIYTLGLALKKIPQDVDLRRAAAALAWGLSCPSHLVHDQALHYATMHRSTLVNSPSGPQLVATMARWENPPTLSSLWAKKMGELSATLPR